MNRFLICLIFLSSCNVFAEYNLYIAIVNNLSDETYKYARKVFPDETFVVTPASMKNSLDFSSLDVDDLFQLACISGGNPDIYIRVSEGTTSGECKSGYSIPRSLEIWTGNPTPPVYQKNIIRFCSTKDSLDRGFIGIRILESGEPRLFAMEGVDFLESPLIVEKLDDEKVVSLSHKKSKK